MALVAMLYAHHFTAATAGEPVAAQTVTGISSVQRQARQARRAGAERVVVLVERVSPGLAAALDDARRDDKDIVVVHGGDGIAGAIRDDDIVLSIDEGLVADERAIAAVLDAPESTSAIAVWREDEIRPISAERIAADSFFAGIGLFPGRLVREVALRLGDWDLQATLLRAALGAGAYTRVEVGGIDTYCTERRRDVPMQWTRVVDEASAHAAGKAALAAAQKGVLDWPARYIHAPIEDALTRMALATRITPNMISVGVFLIGIVAIACFAVGQLWAGLVLALVVGPLDGVDGKLARTRVEFSRWGDLEHVADKIIEYGCFAALAYHFQSGGQDGAWLLAAIIVLFAFAEAVQGEFYRRFTGKQIDDAGEFERKFRIVAGRRNTFFWTILPFAAFGAWYAGFMAIAAYSVLTFFVMQARFFKRLQQYGSDSSAQVAANFAKTAYTFLPDMKASAK